MRTGNADADLARVRRDGSGIWELDVLRVAAGQRYKFAVFMREGARLDKADPFATRAELAPATASVSWPLKWHDWKDADWMVRRASSDALRQPMSVYEVHLGSWRRGEGGALLDYRSIADRLAQYVVELGFTHVELMPIT